MSAEVIDNTNSIEDTSKKCSCGEEWGDWEVGSGFPKWVFRKRWEYSFTVV